MSLLKIPCHAGCAILELLVLVAVMSKKILRKFLVCFQAPAGNTLLFPPHHRGFFMSALYFPELLLIANRIILWRDMMRAELS